MKTTRVAARRRVRGDGRLWFSLFAPVIAWIAAQQTSFLLSRSTCDTGRRWVLYLVMGSAAATAVAGGLAGWKSWAKLREKEETADPTQSRRRFMAIGGLFVAAFFLIAILALAVPAIVHRPCD